MNNKNKLRFKVMFLLSIYFYMLDFFCAKKYNELDLSSDNCEIFDFIPYSQYSGGDIYILPSEFENISKSNNGDVFIVDIRSSNNPDFQICNSFKINNREQMVEILNILLEYEKENPSDWNRTLSSMLNEWYIHNMCYYNGIFPSRTSCVDMDNEDESKYTLKFIDKYFK